MTERRKMREVSEMTKVSKMTEMNEMTDLRECSSSSVNSRAKFMKKDSNMPVCVHVEGRVRV